LPVVARTMPEMTLTKVLFPAPFAPITETICPSSTSNETSCNTRARPYCALMDRTLSKEHLLPQIGFYDGGVFDSVAWFTFKNLLAMVQDYNLVRQCHYSLHDVFDHYD